LPNFRGYATWYQDLLASDQLTESRVLPAHYFVGKIKNSGLFPIVLQKRILSILPSLGQRQRKIQDVVSDPIPEKASLYRHIVGSPIPQNI